MADRGHQPAAGDPSGGAPPILVLGTTRDDATPYAQAVRLARALGSGVLLSFDGDGHLAHLHDVRCIDRRVDRFLLTAVMPRPGTRCGGAPHPL